MALPQAPNRHSDDRRLLIVAVVLTAGIFVLDAYLPLGVAISALYGIVILLGLFIGIPRFPLWAAAVATLLTAVGAWISPPGGPVLYALVNRALTLAGMWITAWLVNKYGKVGRALERTVKDLADTNFALDQAAIVATTDVKGRITYANDRFVEISKYSRQELIGQDHRLINSGHHPKEFIRDLWHTIASGRIWRGEIRNRAKDGSYYWVDTTIVPFLNEQAKPYQYMAIRYDITDRKESEARLREQAALARLGEMAAVVAHEVKNPIAGIRGALQVIGGRLPDATVGRPFTGRRRLSNDEATVGRPFTGRRRLSYNEVRELDTLPGKIAGLEDEQKRLQEEVAGPEFYKRPAEEIAATLARLEAVGPELDVLLTRWMELEERR